MKHLLMLTMAAAIAGGTAFAAEVPWNFMGPLQEGDTRAPKPADAPDEDAGAAEDPAAAIGGGLDQAIGASGGTFADGDFQPGELHGCDSSWCFVGKTQPNDGYIKWNIDICDQIPECKEILDRAKKKQQEREQKAADAKAKAEEEKRKQAAAKKASDDAAKKALDDANKNMFGANSADASRDIPG
ncbi:MAG: hypothetical protein HY748_06935, partial [Elusimicrobia bacterium]|nr:hypothetical protein [Elusimicrobiota bacterium]